MTRCYIATLDDDRSLTFASAAGGGATVFSEGTSTWGAGAVVVSVVGFVEDMVASRRVGGQR